MKSLHEDNTAALEGNRVGYFVYGYADAPSAPPITVVAIHPDDPRINPEKGAGLLGNVTLLAANAEHDFDNKLNAEETTCYILVPAKDGQPERAFLQPLETNVITARTVDGKTLNVDKAAVPFREPVEMPVARVGEVIGKENLQNIRQQMEYDRNPGPDH